VLKTSELQPVCIIRPKIYLKSCVAKGYWIKTYKSISNIRKVEAYAKLAGPTIEAHGGMYLARRVAVATYGQGMKERKILSVFPSVGDAIAAHESEDYAAALTTVSDGAVREICIVEGTA
jgi:uncharacterized protein (DUF1330 family)